ncbi:c-type cytochrome biogenesis protein CcmI [Thalassotalea fusca]
MIELLMILIGFVLLLLIVIWKHFIQQPKHVVLAASNRDQTNIELYHEHKAEIENDLKQGNIDEENYQYLLTELDQSLLQDMEHADKEKALSDSDKLLSIVWPAVISIFVIAFSVYFYTNNGSYQLITETPRAQAPDQQTSMSAQQQAVERVQMLQQLTTQEPNNSDAWYGLGQALVAVGDFDGSLKAFDEVIRIDGEQADLYGAKAQATYYQNNQQITPQVKLWIDKALSLDPEDPSTNILLGMDNFMRQQYTEAIGYWQRVVDGNRDNVNIGALTGAIAEAKNRLAMSSGSAQNDFTAKTEANDSAATSGPQLTLDVRVSDDIQQQLEQGADKVVFVYAIPSNGPRMPVAAVKMYASDLPATVVLNDARAMTPQAKLSDNEKVHVYAVISASGGVGIKSGDYKAELLNVAVADKAPVTLLINSIVE